jgi:hypothetical protein
VRQQLADKREDGFFVLAELNNHSGLTQVLQNRAEVAKIYSGVTEIVRTEFEAKGATVVLSRVGGDRIAAIVVYSIDEAYMDSAIDAIDNRVDAYIRRQGLADIANPSDVEQPGLRLRLGYADIEAHRDIGDIAAAAQRRMSGRDEGPFYNREYDGISKNRVVDDLSAAGLAPAEPGTSEFDAYIGDGEQEINWAVLMDGRLVISPVKVDLPGEGMVPIGHAALTGDVPKMDDWVQTAGLARIQKTDEGYQGMTIHNYSGHYRPTPSSLVLHALPTFADYGITFPKKGIRFEFGRPPPGW